MMICLGLTLSATEMFSGQVAAALQASSITHSPIAGISADFLGHRDEDVGRHQPALRVVPANQRLEADQLLVLGVDQRLEHEVELLAPRAPREGRFSIRTRSSCSD